MKKQYKLIFAILFGFNVLLAVVGIVIGASFPTIAFSIRTGRVWVAAPGTELFQVPLFDQRGEFETVVHLKAADNTEFTARPAYSYRVIKNRSIDVVFDNKHIDSGRDFMESLEDNILEPRVYDLIKEESRKHKTESLMADGGSLAF